MSKSTTTRDEPPCLVCGRVSNKPMCYRGEPWCCERHKSQVEARGEGVLDRALKR